MEQNTSAKSNPFINMAGIRMAGSGRGGRVQGTGEIVIQSGYSSITRKLEEKFI